MEGLQRTANRDEFGEGCSNWTSNELGSARMSNGPPPMVPLRSYPSHLELDTANNPSLVVQLQNLKRKYDEAQRTIRDEKAKRMCLEDQLKIIKSQIDLALRTWGAPETFINANLFDISEDVSEGEDIPAPPPPRQPNIGTEAQRRHAAQYALPVPLPHLSRASNGSLGDGTMGDLPEARENPIISPRSERITEGPQVEEAAENASDENEDEAQSANGSDETNSEERVAQVDEIFSFLVPTRMSRSPRMVHAELDARANWTIVPGGSKRFAGSIVQATIRGKTIYKCVTCSHAFENVAAAITHRRRRHFEK